MGHVERHHDEVDSTPKHDVGGVRVVVDVEFGGRGGVPTFEEPAPHEHDSGDVSRDVGRLPESRTEIGERSERAQGEARRGSCRLDDEVDGMAVGRCGRRVWCVGPVDPGLAVDVLGGDERSDHRPVAAGIDGNIGASGQLGHHERIASGQFERNIAGHRRNAEDIQLLGRCQRQQQRNGVVLAGICIDDDRHRHGPMPTWTTGA